jgi:uncharacterized protein (TIGR02452 family)
LMLTEWGGLDPRSYRPHQESPVLVEIAQETLKVLAEGGYAAPSGRRVDVRAWTEAAVQGTRLYRPGELDVATLPPTDARAPRVEVTDEKTGAAARRLVEEGVVDVAVLNFASARNPGGGFLRGARAQEEDLARCSALFACLDPQRTYYAVNRANPSLLYTHHLIYSPRVPFFRDEQRRFLEAPFLASVITSPAPNAGEALKRDPDAGPAVLATLRERAGHVLTAAVRHGHRTLVLGAWGCGVFRNDPREVARVFADWLAAPQFRGAFDCVVFAVYDGAAGQPNLHAFREQFGGA